MIFSPVCLFDGGRWWDGWCHSRYFAQEVSPAIHVRHTGQNGDDGVGGGDDGGVDGVGDGDHFDQDIYALCIYY